MTKDTLIALAKSVAAHHLLDPVLVCAIIEQESGWNEVAYRYEPAFQMRYVAGLGLDPVETYNRSCSYGLMQLMGQCAREMGFTASLTDLFEPEVNLDYGCRHFAAKLQHADGDKWKALLLWNGGSAHGYPGEVLDRMERYR